MKKLSSLRALVIEDDEVDRRVIEFMLAADLAPGESAPGASYADSLAKAVELLDGEPFDVILTDLGLPDSWGLETLAALTRVARSTPIVVVSGATEQNLALESVRRGAVDYLPKSELAPPMLRRVLRYAFEHAQFVKDRDALDAHQLQASRYQALGLLTAGLLGRAGSVLPSGDAGTQGAGEPAAQALANLFKLTAATVGYSEPCDRTADIEGVDVNGAVRHAFELARGGMPGLSCELDLDSGEPSILCRPRLLEQIVLSLLVGMACPQQHGPESADGSAGSLRVSTRSEGSQLRLAVEFFGSSVNDPAAAKVFRSNELARVGKSVEQELGGRLDAGRAQPGGECVSLLVPLAGTAENSGWMPDRQAG